MLVLVLLLAMITIMMITLAGALLQVTSALPDEPLLKIFTRYLKKGGDNPDILSPEEARKRMGQLRRKVIVATGLVLFAGVALTVASLARNWQVESLLLSLFLTLVFNGLIVTGVLSLWIRRLRRITRCR